MSTKICIVLISVALLFNCVNDRTFDVPQSNCNSELIANTTYIDVKALYDNETFRIQEDLVIEGETGYKIDPRNIESIQEQCLILERIHPIFRQWELLA